MQNSYPPPAHVPDELLLWLAEQRPATSVQVGKWVRALSDSYVDSHAPAAAAISGAHRLSAYARYYLPVNYPKLHLPLAELALHADADPLRGEKLRVLDLGCGPGTFLLSVLGFLGGRRAHPKALELVGVDIDRRALELAREACEWQAARCLPETDVRVLTREADLFAPLPAEYRGRGFDVIVIGNALAEWARGAGADIAQAAARAKEVLGMLRGGGALVVIEPALRDTSRFLLQVRDALLAEEAAHLYAPCLHEMPCPALARERDWCHERLDWEMPRVLEEIDRAAGLQKGSLAFSYLVLRREAGSLADLPAPAGIPEGIPAGIPEGWTRARVVSDQLSEKGKRGCIACTQGGCRVYYETLDRKSTRGTLTALEGLRRGSLAAFAPGRAAGDRTRLGEGEAPLALLTPPAQE